MPERAFTADDLARFAADGFLVFPNLIASADASHAAARFAPLFDGTFETGVAPDEWNWRAGRDAPDHTRQICNGWKADTTVASIVLRAEIGRLCATLAGWPGARLCQDNVIWKPPGAKPLGFHQDNSYCDWFVPADMLTCWIALDDTTAAGGTIEYVPGSHRWGKFPPIVQFHAPDDYRKELDAAAAHVGQTAQVRAIEVAPGDCIFHHGSVWHGSGTNRADLPRRALVAHCMSSQARFHPTLRSAVYSRYMRHGDAAMDESFFPILWTRDGGRTQWLDGAVRAD